MACSRIKATLNTLSKVGGSDGRPSLSTYLQRSDICNKRDVVTDKLFVSARRAIKTTGPLQVNYYEALGVNKTATQDEIKKAYFKKVKECHPDVNKASNAAEKFREVQEAYECLSHPNRRRQYDVTGNVSAGKGNVGGSGHDYRRSSYQPNYQGYSNQSQGQRTEHQFNFEDIFGGGSDFFKDIFRSHSRPSKFQVQLGLKISFVDSILGGKKPVKVSLVQSCKTCSGSGVRPGSTFKTCVTCNGRGSTRTTQGNVIFEVACPTCNGVGQINTEPCVKCGGRGKQHSQVEIQVPISAGIDSGATVHMGDDLNDIFVTIQVEPNPMFRKERNDIHSDLFVDIFTAVLGGEISGQTVYGNTPVVIPKGVNSHHKIRVPGKGVPIGRGYSGDHIFNVNIVVPKNLSKGDIEAIQLLRSKLEPQVKKEVEEKNTSNTRFSRKTTTDFTSNRSSISFSSYRAIMDVICVIAGLYLAYVLLRSMRIL